MIKRIKMILGFFWIGTASPMLLCMPMGRTDPINETDLWLIAYCTVPLIAGIVYWILTGKDPLRFLD